MMLQAIRNRADQLEPRSMESSGNSPELEENEFLPAFIVQGLISRDSKAALLFYHKYGRLISHLVWRLLGADEDHDDVVHQVYINVLESIDSLRKPDSLKSWVTGVVINTVRREIYRKKFRRLFHLGFEYSESELFSVSPEQGLAVRKLYQLLDRLKAEQRIVLLLNIMEGYTLSEIAQLCKISLPTTKRRFQAGKKRFCDLAENEPLLTEWIRGQKSES